MNDQTKSGPTPEETTVGHATVNVTYINGQSEPIEVRQLPLRRMKQLALAIDDPAAVIMLTCGRKEEWVDALTPDSFELLASEADRVNRDFFVRWGAIQQRRLAVLGAGAVVETKAS